MKNEHIKRFDELYDKMSGSSEIKDMELFGKVMREAMQYIVSHSPAYAEELTEKLEAINYKNYLTRKEAEDIIMSMQPAPKWSIEQMKRMLAASGAPKEEEPYYNECALYTTMAMIASDSIETLTKYATADENILMEMVYHLAMDKLKDKDGKFCIRKYFDI